MSFFNINGFAVKTPISVEWTLSDVSTEDSGRTRQDAKMHKDVVAQKRTLKVKWGNMDWKDAVLITQYCKKKGVQVALTYPDIMEGTTITKDFYTGDCTAKYRIWTDDQQQVEYVNCDFIEM